jgi:hypothetical protein
MHLRALHGPEFNTVTFLMSIVILYGRANLNFSVFARVFLN